jgi:hypothetical protein
VLNSRNGIVFVPFNPLLRKPKTPFGVIVSLSSKTSKSVSTPRILQTIIMGEAAGDFYFRQALRYKQNSETLSTFSWWKKFKIRKLA